MLSTNAAPGWFDGVMTGKTRYVRGAIALVVFSITAVVGERAVSAQDIDVDVLRPSSPGDGDLFSVHTVRQSPPGLFSAGFSLGVADDPLVVVASDGTEQPVVDTRMVADLAAAYSLGRIELSAALPVVALQDGDPAAMADADAGIGDLRVAGRMRILGTGTGLSSGVVLATTFPTAMRASFTGRDTPTLSPALVAEYREDRFVAAVNAGAQLREDQRIGDLTIGHAFTYGVGVAVNVPEARLTLLSELAGEAAGGRSEEVPLELRGGARLHVDDAIALSAGYGRGLTLGYGTPDHRAFVVLSYRPSAPAVAEVPEPLPQRQRIEVGQKPENPDPDRDGILGSEDACPDDAEDFDGFEDEDGCPESDNDGDGLADAGDKCPNHPEDVDGFEDDDGCPDPDNDFDGIADADDKCPNDAEIINGVDDDDGCPDEGKTLVVVGETKIEIREKLYFATNKDVILPRSEPLLEQLAKTLARKPSIKKVRIEGYTDNRGSASFNLDLSQRRADSVRTALIERGVAAERLESKGYGKDHPIDTNKTVDGRAANRRVEFTILEKDGQTDKGGQ